MPNVGTAGTYGADATRLMPIVTTDAQGRVSGASTVAVATAAVPGVSDISLSGTLSALNLQLGTGVVGSTEITDNSIVDGDVNANAQINVNKLAEGTATGQILRTNGTNVEWANVSDAMADLTIGAGLSTEAATYDGSTPVTISLNLGRANIWTATQTLPLTDAQGAALIGSVNSATTATINAARIGNGLTNTQVNDDLTIVGGTINNTPIGGTTPSTGAFTTLTSNGNAVLTTATSFSGDVSGLYNDLQLGTDVVGANELADNSVASANIIDDAVAAVDLNADVAGAGLVQNASGALDVRNTDGTITVTADDITLNVGHANTWTALQTLPLTDAQGAALIGSINSATTATINATRIGNGLTDAQVNDNLTINGGTINNTPIGATTASTGKFTDLNVSGNFNFDAGQAVDEIVTVINDADNTALPTEGAVFNAITAINAEPFITWQASTTLTNDKVFAADATLTWNSATATIGMPNVGTAGIYGADATRLMPIITTDAQGRVSGASTVAVATAAVPGISDIGLAGPLSALNLQLGTGVVGSTEIADGTIVPADVALVAPGWNFIAPNSSISNLNGGMPGAIPFQLGPGVTQFLPPAPSGFILNMVGPIPQWVPSLNDTQVNDNLTINGGTISNSPISGSTGSFTTLTASGATTLAPNGGTITADRFVGIGSTTNAVDLGTAEVAGQLATTNIAPGTAGQFLITNGSNATAWSTPSINTTNFTGNATTTQLAIAAGGVGTTEIANDAVTTGKILNGTILPEDLSSQTPTPWVFAAPVDINNTLNVNNTVTLDGAWPEIRTISPDAPTNYYDLRISADGSGRVMINDNFGVMGDQTGYYLSAPSTYSIGYTLWGNGNFDLNGYIRFDAGQLVDGIVTTIGTPGLNTNLPTEAAVRTAVDAVMNDLKDEPFLTYGTSTTLTQDRVFSSDATLTWNATTATIGMPSVGATGTWGSNSLQVPSVTVDAQGRVTTASNLTVASAAVPGVSDISLSGTLDALNLQLGLGVVTTTEILDLTIATGDIADGAITTPKINNLDVTTAKIANNAVTAAKINANVAGNGLVQAGSGALDVNPGTGISIVGDAVTATDASITNETITAFSWETAGSKTLRITEAGTNYDAVLTNVAEYDDEDPDFTNRLQVGNVNVVLDNDNPSDGDISGSYTDGFQIVADAVTANEIAADAVGASELADNSVASANIIDDAVSAADLNPDVAGAGLLQNVGTGAIDVQSLDGSITVNANDIVLNMNHTNTWNALQSFNTANITTGNITTVNSTQVNASTINASSSLILGSDLLNAVTKSTEITGVLTPAPVGDLNLVTEGAVAEAIAFAAGTINAEPFITFGTSTNLTAEKVLTAGAGLNLAITGTDGGSATLSIPTGGVTSAMIADDAIVDGDVSTTAEIAVNKLANGTANQVLLTDGTNNAWGLIANANIDPAAGIVDTKLATISTAGKVANSATSATSVNTPSTIVLRDASGNFAAGTITANLSGNATTATTATNFTGSLLGDVTGTQGATVVSTVGGMTAANVAAGATLANNATNSNTASTIVRRDASGNFAAGTITANLTGNVTGNLTGDVTGNVSGNASTATKL
jgi:hypothetical protein